MAEERQRRSLDYALKASQLWTAFDDNQRTGVSIGVFPFDEITQAERDGYETQPLAVALMRLARADPSGRDRTGNTGSHPGTNGNRPERFPLGQTVATPGALELLETLGASPLALLTRHQSGDWGDVPPEDAAENELSVTEGLRILSSYRVGRERLWVITEADRSVTTILKPDEY